MTTKKATHKPVASKAMTVAQSSPATKPTISDQVYNLQDRLESLAVAITDLTVALSKVMSSGETAGLTAPDTPNLLTSPIGTTLEFLTKGVEAETRRIESLIQRVELV